MFPLSMSIRFEYLLGESERMMLALGIGKKNDLLGSVDMKDMMKIDDILSPHPDEETLISVQCTDVLLHL